MFVTCSQAVLELNNVSFE